MYFTIEPADSIFISASHSNILCYGNADGTITLNALGGTPGYSYMINGVGNMVNTFSSLVPGNYAVHVVDSLGCISDTIDILITEPLELTGLANSSPETDNGWNDGTATITPSGGMSPYNYLVE